MRKRHALLEHGEKVEKIKTLLNVEITAEIYHDGFLGAYMVARGRVLICEGEWEGERCLNSTAQTSLCAKVRWEACAP